MDQNGANLGRLVPGFTPPPRPNAPVLQGQFARFEFPKWTSAILVWIFTSTPAMSEVCDKANPFWHPEQGPVTQLGELLAFLMNPIVIIVLLLVAGSILSRRPFFMAIAAAFLLLLTSLMATDLISPHDVAVAAYAEGCRAPPYTTVMFLVLLIIFLLSRIAYHFVNKRKIPPSI